MYHLDCREELAKTFIHLLSEMDYSEISVKRICDQTGVSKSTFYRNFHDLYALQDYLIIDHLHCFDGFSHLAAGDCSLLSALQQVLRAHYQNRTILTKLWSFGGQNSIYETMLSHVRSLIPDDSLSEERLVFVKDLLLGFSYGVIGLIKEWLFRDVDFSGEPYAEVLYHLCPKVLIDEYDPDTRKKGEGTE